MRWLFSLLALVFSLNEEDYMPKKIECILCESDAEEYSISGQDKYEIRCETCTIYYLTSLQDEGFLSLSQEDRLALSAFVREQYQKTKTPVHLDYVENFQTIIDDFKGRSDKS